MRLDSVCIMLRALGVAAMIALITACSLREYSGSSPESVTAQRVLFASPASMTGAAGLQSAIKVDPSQRLPVVDFYSCPAKGPLEYVSDYNNNIIDVYKGNFTGQAPCARIRSGLLSPWGLYVQTCTHDLLVANALGHDILAFHRGQTAPFNRYTDPTLQPPVDVVETNGTIVASNLATNTSKGSLSAWIEGPRGGRFTGNFRITENAFGAYLTANNGIVFFDDLPTATSLGHLWRVSCPAGACGTQTQVTGVTVFGPGGIAFDTTNDMIVAEGATGKIDTFELPNPVPTSFSVTGAPTGIAFDPARRVLFVADGLNNDAAEYTYPGGALIGTVAGNAGGGTFGVAVDPD